MAGQKLSDTYEQFQSGCERMSCTVSDWFWNLETEAVFTICIVCIMFFFIFYVLPLVIAGLCVMIGDFMIRVGLVKEKTDTEN